MIVYFETAPDFRTDTVFGEPYVGILQRDTHDDSLFVTRYQGSLPIYSEHDPDVIEHQSWCITINQPTVFEVHVNDNGAQYYYCDTHSARVVDYEEAQTLCHAQLENYAPGGRIWLRNCARNEDGEGMAIMSHLLTPFGKCDLLEMMPGTVAHVCAISIDLSSEVKDLIHKGMLEVLNYAEVCKLGDTKYVDDLSGNSSCVYFNPKGDIVKTSLK